MKYDIFVKELDKLADNDAYETYQDCLNALSADAKAEWEELAYSACGYYSQDDTAVVDYDNGMFYYADDDNVASKKMKELTDVENCFSEIATAYYNGPVTDKQLEDIVEKVLLNAVEYIWLQNEADND